MMKSERRALYFAEVTAKYSVTEADILGFSYDPRIWAARREVMCRFRDAGYSLTQIGAATNRHHTTVLSALRTAAR